LRNLLEKILPHNNSFNDFQVEHEFPTIGMRTMLLNARRIMGTGSQPQMILLAIEDISPREIAR
jgi:two-component system CheB/CheR fusion protein